MSYPLVVPQTQPQSQGVQAHWVELIMPVMIGVMMLVFVAGMVRDLFKGKEVKLPLTKD